MNLSQVITKPLITEKTMRLAEQNQYSFRVDKRSNKKMVKQAIEEFLKVKVKKVRLMKVQGKKKRVGRLRRKVIKQPDWKKAIVLLEPGQKMDIFENIAKK